jgi:hypothetical protein
MEEKQLSDLVPHDKNPRTISHFDFKNLQMSIEEYGDLSGIVNNLQTKRLVGGHQRRESFLALPADKRIVITQRFDHPNSVGTVAVGYVVYKDEFFAYREVMWDEAKEIAANIAANRITGDWDQELLAEHDQWLKDNNPDLLKKTGQSDDEIARLLGNGPEQESDDADNRSSLNVKLTDDQFAVVEEAIARMKAKQSFAHEPNKDFDGNAIFYVCQEWLSSQPVQ